MPRKKQGKHTCPENAGAQNFSAEYIESHKADALTQDIMRRTQTLLDNRTDYKGAWTDEEFTEYVNKYFQFTAELGLEPCRAGLTLWLDVDRNQLTRWMNDPKYGVKCSEINKAMTRMEMTYFNKLDSRPIPQMFKLKTGFGYVENQKVEIVADAKVSADEIKAKLAQMVTETN